MELVSCGAIHQIVCKLVNVTINGQLVLMVGGTEGFPNATKSVKKVCPTLRDHPKKYQAFYARFVLHGPDL